MPVTLTLDSHAERLLEAQLHTGRFQSPEEVVTRALEALAEHEPPKERRKKTVAEAVAHIRQSRKGVTLGGLCIKDLIHASHKY